MIKVAVNGAKGRMGREVVKAVNDADDLVLAATADLGDDLREIIDREKVTTVVDFTIPSCVKENARIILESGAHPVVGTTGLTGEDIRELRRLAEEKQTGGLIAPNFAIGAVLLMHYAAHAVRHMNSVEIIELHHDNKLDAPSGTAALTAQKIARAHRTKEEKKQRDETQGFRGGEVDGIHIHSVRLPGLVAHQEVIFGAPGQTLTIRHDSLSRESFMPGVVFAIRKVQELKKLVVGLETLLNL